jgi:hypothetical protein
MATRPLVEEGVNPKKPDFSKYRPFRNLLPRKFVTDGGQEFDIRVVKPTVASFHLELVRGGQVVNRLKVRKTNHRLRYLVDGNLVAPADITSTKKES